MNGTIVYVAAQFPKLSETFVYKEVRSLREAGVDVRVVSVREPELEVSDPEVTALQQGVIQVYGSGGVALLRDVIAEVCVHPFRSLGTLGYGISRAFCRDAPSGGVPRLKVMLQSVASLALARRLRSLQPRLLHAHMAHVPTTFAMLASRQLGVPFSFTGHAADLFRDRSLLVNKLQAARFVHCISYWHRSFYQQLVPRPEQDYPIIRCGVLCEEVRREEATGPVRLLAVGRLVRKKGFDVLLDALASDGLQELDWRLTLIGDGPEAAALQAQLREHPARDRITMTGAMSNQDVRTWMLKSDVFVLPCRVDEQGDRDGIPVVLMEAMAAGVAVVSGDLPSIRELVEDGITGHMVPPGDVEALERALVALCADRAACGVFQKAARERIQTEFSLAVNTKRILENVQEHSLWTA